MQKIKNKFSMELSTKKLFSSKTIKARKKLIPNKKEKISIFKSNIKPKESATTKLKRNTTKEKGNNKLGNNEALLSKINPFTSNQKKFKKKIKYNNLSSKFEISKFNTIKINHFLNNTQEDISDFTNTASTARTEMNRQIQDEFDLDKLHNEFKNSKLKSNFIIDDNGNNNLNSEQKKIIEDYFNNRKDTLQNNINKCKINGIKMKKSNKFGKQARAFYSTIVHYKNSLDFGRRFLSSKEHNKIKNFLDTNVIKINYNDESKDNNSLFETFSGKSNDSSFINSDEDENLISAFQKNCSKN